jgi:hypothetical protein
MQAQADEAQCPRRDLRFPAQLGDGLLTRSGRHGTDVRHLYPAGDEQNSNTNHGSPGTKAGGVRRHWRAALH